MKAMLLKGKNQPFVLENVPDPVPGPGEAVAKVLACGAGALVLPQALGANVSGVITTAILCGIYIALLR